ncbi:hypothetical protein, partial [Profundibacter sp.]
VMIGGYCIQRGLADFQTHQLRGVVLKTLQRVFALSCPHGYQSTHPVRKTDVSPTLAVTSRTTDCPIVSSVDKTRNRIA